MTRVSCFSHSRHATHSCMCDRWIPLVTLDMMTGIHSSVGNVSWSQEQVLSQDGHDRLCELEFVVIIFKEIFFYTPK